MQAHILIAGEEALLLLRTRFLYPPAQIVRYMTHENVADYGHQYIATRIPANIEISGIYFSPSKQ